MLYIPIKYLTIAVDLSKQPINEFQIVQKIYASKCNKVRAKH